MNTSSRFSPAASSHSRRSFLRHLGLGGAATLVPATVLGRGALGAPSERVNMGFIGLGGQGTGHLLGGAWTYVPGGYVARKDVQVLAVCDVQRERRESAQLRCNQMYAQKLGQAGYQGVQAYNDFRDVLARPDIDAVLIAVPYHWAALLATMALRAGKDVYCEKPIAITVREGLNLAETCARFGRVYQAGTQQRSEYAGRFRTACELVRDGRIGQLKEVYAVRQPGAFYPTPWTSDARKDVPPGLDWDLWLGPLPWRPYNGETGHALSGCYVGDINWTPHHYDFVQWVVNPDPTAPIEVWYEKGPGGLDTAVIHYRYSHGVVVHSTPYPGEPIGGNGGACFVGTEGRIAADRDAIVSYPSSILRAPLRTPAGRVYYTDSHSGNFLDCIRSRRPTICNPKVATYSMNAILIGGIALILQRALKWDPVKAEFLGDPEANRLLSYTPRPPWHL